MLPYQTIKQRKAFVAATRQGKRHASKTLVVQFIPADDTLQLGITVTKKVGNAPVRNRIKRQLRAAFTEAAKTASLPNGSYVIIARNGAYAAPYARLLQDLRYCIRKVTA